MKRSEFAFRMATLVAFVVLVWVLLDALVAGVTFFRSGGDALGMIWPIAVAWIVFWMAFGEWFESRGK